MKFHLPHNNFYNIIKIKNLLYPIHKLGTSKKVVNLLRYDHLYYFICTASNV